MKLTLPIFMGLSVLTLTACDNQEVKTPEKTTALSETSINQNSQEKTDAPVVAETTVMPAAEVSQTVEKTSQTTAVSDTLKPDTAKDEAVETKLEPEKTKSELEQTKPEPEKAKVQSSVAKTDAQPTSSNDSKKVSKKVTKVNHENAYLKEQKALLKVLESQYQQVRCTAEAAKLGENSFCRQEERRLLLEIERVKGEIRLNR